MLNHLVLIGKLYSIQENTDNTIITLAIPRLSTQKEGEKDSYIDCIVNEPLAENIKEYC